jgi:4-amino-4-deoxy-L-arabinose transferase-like glycosyltransferase
MFKRLRRADPILLLLLLVGLLLRLWYAGVHNGRSAFFADEGDYYARAIRMAFGAGYSDDFWLIRPPLVVWWLAAIFKATALVGLPQHILLATRLIQIGLSLAVTALLYDTGRLIYGRAAGRWAAAGWAVLFAFVRLPALLLVENLFLALFSLVLWALARYQLGRQSGQAGLRWIAIAGLALGVATLSRSTLLWFLPVFAWWLWQIERRQQPAAAALRIAGGRWLILAGLTLLMIAPWTWRNYRAYHALVPVDTMLGANLWLDADEIDSRRGDNPKIIALQAIPDPVARDDYARAQAWDVLRRDPAAKIRRSWAQVQHALRLEFMANFFDRPSLDSEPLRQVWPLAAPSDLLTVVLLLATVWGAFSPYTRGPFKTGLLCWLALNLAVIVVFHSETRYLLPIYHAGLLLGGAALAQGGRRFGGWRLAGAAATMLVLGLSIISYKNYARLIINGLEREVALGEGWTAYATGDWGQALASAEQAQAADPDFEEPGWLAALALAERDGPEAGLAPANQLISRSPREPHARLIRAELLRRLGRLAEAEDDAARAEVAAPEDLLQWSWNLLRTPPTSTLELDGNAFGLVRGWWPAEQGARAATRRAEVRLLVPSSAQPQLSLRVRARPPLPLGTVDVLADGVRVGSFLMQPDWAETSVPLPAALAGREVVFSFVGPTVVLAGGAPGTDMLRVSGIEVSRVAAR